MPLPAALPPQGSTQAEVVVTEGVWGTPFDELAKSHHVVSTTGGSTDIPDELLRGARALVVRNRTQVDADLLARAPHLQIVARAGAGLDNLDLNAITAAGTVAVAALGANAASVAEHAVAGALALSKDLLAGDHGTRQGEWDRRPRRELAGGTWGLISAGATARATGRLATGLGMRVLAHDPYLEPADPRLADSEIRLAPLADVLAEADVVSVHLPATTATTGLIDAEFLAAMKDTAILVNVGRGETIDEAALVDALRRGHLGGAALDVRATEPPQVGPLERAPRTLLSPHVAGITTAAQARITTVLCRDIAAVLDGRPARAAVAELSQPLIKDAS